MLRIRLQRIGRKNIPVFRLVVTESQNSTKSGRFLEVLGSFDAHDDSKQTVDAERVKHWISKGAKPTDTVHNFLLKKKVITGKTINSLPRKNPIKKDEPAAVAPAVASPVPAAEAPKA